MASETRGSSNGFLYFIVGALLVAVAVLAFLSYNGTIGRSPEEAAIERSADAIGDAAREVGDATRDAARNVPAPDLPAPNPPATEPLPQPAPTPRTDNP